MTSIIANLRQLRSAGILADRTTKSASLQFRKYNLVYGFNGSGKSTLSRLFASLEHGELEKKLPNNCTFEMTMDDGATFGWPDRPKGLERRVLVFNSDFQEKNFQWSSGRANPVFFIGADQAQAAAELARLETEIPLLLSRQTTAATLEKSTEKEVARYKRDRAKITAPRLHLGNRKYEAPQFLADYEAWSGEQLSLLGDEELKAAEDTRRLAEPMPSLARIQFDAQRLLNAFKFVVEICGQRLSEVALDEIKRFPEMLIWIKQGQEFHQYHNLSDCLLCGNVFTIERKEALKRALDSQIDQFVEKLRKTAERFDTVVAEIDSLALSFPSIEAFSSEFRPDFKKESVVASANIRRLKEHIGKLRKALAEKQNRPAMPVDILQVPSQEDVEIAVRETSKAIEAVNLTIERHNKLVADFATHRENAGILIRKHFIAECYSEFSALLVDMDKAKKELEGANHKLQEANTRAEELRRQIRAHGPAADAMNLLIKSYLGHDELTISPIDEGYEIHRYGRAIDGLPSEGEKTAIAISYFLSKIESDGRKLKDLIVVVDDPVSSLDTKALNYACSLVRGRLSRASQLFILTHNQQCMNEFRKAWKNKANPPEGKEASAAFLFIDVAIPPGQTKRCSSFVDMPKLLREYDSEYHYLFQHVLRFTETSDRSSEYSYMMPNVLRRVLDVFFGFKCPGSSGLSSKIDQICSQYPDLDRDRLGALERLSQVESHSDNLDDLISFSSMTLEESKGAAEALLSMMTHIDEKHVAALRHLCR